MVEAMVCSWGKATADDGRIGFAIHLVGLHGIELVYIFQDPSDIEKLIRDASAVLDEMVGRKYDPSVR